MTRQLAWICRDLFQEHLNELPNTVKCRFALPGIERQDSVYSGLQEIRPKAALVAVHDSARPLLDSADAAACMADAQEVCWDLAFLVHTCMLLAPCKHSNSFSHRVNATAVQML